MSMVHNVVRYPLDMCENIHVLEFFRFWLDLQVVEMLLKRFFDFTTLAMIKINTAVIYTCAWCIMWSDIHWICAKISINNNYKNKTEICLFVQDFAFCVWFLLLLFSNLSLCFLSFLSSL
jgi:hypothetical protein